MYDVDSEYVFEIVSENGKTICSMFDTDVYALERAWILNLDTADFNIAKLVRPEMDDLVFEMRLVEDELANDVHWMSVKASDLWLVDYSPKSTDVGSKIAIYFEDWKVNVIEYVGLMPAWAKYWKPVINKKELELLKQHAWK